MKRPVYGLTIVAITSLALILVARFEVSVPERKSQGAISDHQAKAVAIPIAGLLVRLIPVGSWRRAVEVASGLALLFVSVYYARAFAALI